MKQKDDQYYLNKVLAGDVNAYEVLVDRYKNMFYTVALRVARNESDA